MRSQQEYPIKVKPVIPKNVAAPFLRRCFLYIQSFTKRLTKHRSHLKVQRRWLFFLNAVSYRKPLTVTKVIQYNDGCCFPVCPRCTTSMNREYMSYCDRCGQRLSWHRFDDAEIIYPGRR